MNITAGRHSRVGATGGRIWGKFSGKTGAGWAALAVCLGVGIGVTFMDAMPAFAEEVDPEDPYIDMCMEDADRCEMLAAEGNIYAQHRLAVQADVIASMAADDGQLDTVSSEVETALKWYGIACGRGYASSCFNLASLYYYGAIVPENQGKAIELFEMAGRLGYGPSESIHLRIGLANYHSKPPDYEAAVREFKMAAHKEGEAQLMLGYCYEYGHGVDADQVQAFSWYQKASDGGRGLFRATKKVADAYRGGKGVQQDFSAAFSLYWDLALPAHKGKDFYNDVAYAIAISLRNGLGVRRDDADAVRWLRRAGREGGVESIDVVVGHSGAGTAMRGSDRAGARLECSGAVDIDSCVSDLNACEARARAGDSEAMLQNGIFQTRDPRHEVVQKGIQSLRNACDSKNARACFQLGEMYLDGHKVPEDPKNALSFFNKAKSAGCADDAVVLRSIGLCWASGEKPDYKSALRYLKQAAVSDGVAQYSIGSFHLLGRGLKKDPGEAIKWFTKAALEHNNVPAMYELAKANFTGAGVKENHYQALKWAWMAGNPNNAGNYYYRLALRTIGGMILDGDGILEKDQDDGIRWLQAAARNGDNESAKYLKSIGVAVE